MPFSIQTIMDGYCGSAFFSASRREIETLLCTGLDPLEEFFLFIYEKKGFLITSSNYLPPVDSGLETITVCGVNRAEKIDAILSEAEKIKLPRRLFCGFSRLSADILRDLESRCFSLTDISNQIDALARIKTCSQAQVILANAEMNEHAFAALEAGLCPGITEIEALGLIEQAYADFTSSPPEKVYDLLSGIRTSNISGLPSNRQLVAGDAVIADLLPLRNGLYCDTTRTFFVDQKSALALEAEELVCEALSEGEKVLEPNVSGAEVYAAVADTFAKHDMLKKFPHHAGHGVGFGIFERPYFLPMQKDVLEEGMVVTLEPGLYFEDVLGFRKENNYLITKNGFRRFGKLS